MTKSFRWIAPLFAATMLTVPAWANEEPQYVPPASWVTGADKPVPPGKPVRGKIFLLSDMQSRLDAGRWEIFSDSAYHVASAELLDQLGTVYFEWQPDREDLVIHRLEILREGAVINLLADGKRFTVIRREQQLEENAIDGALTATMAIEGLRVGDTVRFASTHIRTSETLPEHAEALQFLPGPEAQTALATLRFIWPDTLPVRWRTMGDKIMVQEKPGANGMREIHIPLPIAKQNEKPGDAPPRFTMPPQIELSSMASWSDLSRRHAAAYVTDGDIAVNSPLAREVARITAASNDPVKRMTAAVQLVQREVRYLYNGLGTGNYEPQKPSETWQLRSGDCKAKTKLLLALLRELGIAADAVLVHSSLGDALPQRLPALGVFDHVIVRARIGETDYWLDGTASGADETSIGDVPPFRYGLPLMAAGSEISALPERVPARSDGAIELTYDQSYGIVYPPLVTARVTFRGEIADMMKTMERRATSEQMDDMAHAMLSDVTGNGSVISHKLDIIGDGSVVVLEARALGNMFWDRSEGAPQFPVGGPFASFSFGPDRSRTAWKDIPALRPAMRSEIVRHYKLPGDGKAFSIDGAETLDVDVAGVRVERAVTRAGAMISVRETQSSAAGEVAPSAFAAARAAAARVIERPLRFKTASTYPARWQELLATRDSNTLTPLLAAYQAIIDKDPDKALGYVNRAAFYAGIYREELALADYSKALALEDDPATRALRARMLSRLDRLDDALADLDAALDGKPGEANFIDSKVNTLRRLGRFDEALALTDERIEQGGAEKQQWLDLKAEVLGFAGKADEALAVVDEGLAVEPDSSAALNMRCWMRALLNRQLEGALEDCNRAIALSDDPVDKLDSRAMVYFRAGRLAEALADYDAVLMREPGYATSLFMRSIIHARQGRKADAARDLRGARLIDPWVERDMAVWGIKP